MIVSSSKTVVGHLDAGYEPSVTMMQLAGVKSSNGEWLHMGVDASGEIFVSSMYGSVSNSWASFAGAISYPIS